MIRSIIRCLKEARKPPWYKEETFRGLKLITVTVRGVGMAERRRGLAVGPHLAITHRDGDNGLYKVTHRHTGLQAFADSDPRKVIAVARALHYKFGDSMSFKTTKEFAVDSKLLIQMKDTIDKTADSFIYSLKGAVLRRARVHAPRRRKYITEVSGE